MPTATTGQGGFMSTVEARAVLGLNPDQLQRLLKKGLITVRRIPGARPQLLRADVERVAEESIEPATAGA